jgi:two-component system phosphate regulon sensor histidine kinase PhoR
MLTLPLRWRLFPSYLLITFLALGSVSWIASDILHQFYLSDTTAHLTDKARLIEMQLTAPFASRPLTALRILAGEVGRAAGARVTLIRPDGQVLADSQTDPVQMDNHADRPEVIAALQGRIGVAVRYSFTLRSDLLYVALPHHAGPQIDGVLRLALPMASEPKAVRFFVSRLFMSALIVLLVAVVLNLIVSYQISRPLEEIQKGAARLAQGDLSHKLFVKSTPEIGGLAESLNHMAAQLDERMQTLLRQQNEQQAVLASMVEGVLAVDNQERVLNLNQAASQFLGVTPGQATGRSLPEVIRNSQLQQFVSQSLQSVQTLEGDIVLAGEQERYLQAHGTALRDARGQRIGALIVLNDVTRLRRLENVRRDFVANVSHELKTPITLIQGFLETLQEGALKNPQEAQRFLDIMSKQADRLNRIIEDLLSLSRIEQESERGQILLESGRVREVLDSAQTLCQTAAEAKNIRLTLLCPEDLQARMNARLLEQAVYNLLDNAVKYSDPGTEVALTADTRDGEIHISVLDHGPGIEAEHHPRLFERFYRIDKARSREVGGSGLGLAIVKHIALAHGGRVSVQSQPGAGSTFTLHIPIS